MITINIKKATKCNGEYSLYLTFPYDLNIINAVREMPTRYWLNNTKEWEIPFSKLQVILNKFQAYQINIIDKDGYLVFSQEEKKVNLEYKFKTKPFAHQITGVEYGLTHDKWLLGDEQGCGKTKTIIDIACAKKEYLKFRHCLIVCGVNGLKWNWRNEIAVHSNETSHIIGQKVKNNKITIGSNKDKLEDLKHLPDDYFIITNVESLRDEEIVAELVNLCKSGEISMIACDEIHKVSNPSSQQGKGLLKLKSKIMVAMTGTPLMNTPLDLYTIFKWLGYESHSFYSFKQYYCEMGGFGGYQIVGWRHLDELQEQLNSIMLRRLKEDVLDLPEKLFVDEYVEMGAKQQKIYNEVTAEIQPNIDKIKTSNNPLAELIRLRQATGYTGVLSSTVKESAKIDRLEEIVDETIANGKKIVIYSNWTFMTDAIQERLGSKYHLLVITGNVNDKTRQEYIDIFQTNDDYKIILGTVGALGTGVTITKATVVCFVDQPWTYAYYSQAVDRCHRIGQTSNVTIYNLLTKNTIDERIWSIVKKKCTMSKAIVDQEFDISDNDKLVDYLLS